MLWFLRASLVTLGLWVTPPPPWNYLIFHVVALVRGDRTSLPGLTACLHGNLRVLYAVSSNA